MKRHITLSLKEIKKIYACSLTGSEEVLKDRFVIGCITGLFPYAYLTINGDNILNEDEKIIIKDKEHPQPTRILPLHYLVKEIFEKYNYQIPEVNSHNLTKDLQNILRKAKIYHTNPFKRIFSTTPKYQLIKPDMTRAFAIQNMKKAGLSQDAIHLAIGRTLKIPKDAFLIEEKLLNQIRQSSYFKPKTA